MSWQRDEFHTVYLSVDLLPSFHCTAPDDAECRSGCAEECGAWTDGQGCDHELTRPLGYCNVVTWLENTEEAYRGQNRSLPIEFDWEGDYYAWRFPS